MNNILSSIPCWLIPLLVGVISAILGYLLGRLLGGGNNDEEIDGYKKRISELEKDLASCKTKEASLLSASKGRNNNAVDVEAYKKQVNKLELDLAACKSSKAAASNSTSAASAVSSFAAGAAASNISAGSTSSVVAYDAAGAKAVFGKKIKENDLTVVEGIGPKIKELFHNHDVTTWAALADCSVEKCTEVLKSGGKRFDMHKPGTWPKQAGLAAKGLWQELSDWQDQLDGGK